MIKFATKKKSDGKNATRYAQFSLVSKVATVVAVAKNGRKLFVTGFSIANTVSTSIPQ